MGWSKVEGTASRTRVDHYKEKVSIQVVVSVEGGRAEEVEAHQMVKLEVEEQSRLMPHRHVHEEVVDGQ